MEQSPINLPSPKKAIESHLSPFFKYEDVAYIIDETSPDGMYKEGHNLKIVYDQNSIRIKAWSFGKVLTLDGGVYRANEIIFNTPSNHQIEGISYDMEMQIVHKGISDGDIAKSVILSFLFKKKAGASNKFLEKLELFNLPNPLEPFRELENNIFIPSILLQEGDDDIPAMLPFSFYTYSGSLQEPPCSERTIMYVASVPIETSFYSLQLIKEALRFPDQTDQFGNIKVAESIIDNNRAIQNQHGRAIFHYDSSMCINTVKNKTRPADFGHFEKVVKETKQYFHVSGDKPSGLPNAWVVTDKEALGDMIRESD